MNPNDLLNPLALLSRINRRLRTVETIVGSKTPLKEFASNSAALSGGLEIGEFYKTSDGTVKVVQ